MEKKNDYRVVIIEDNKTIRKLCIRVLEKNGYDIKAFETADDFFEKPQPDIDVYFTDLNTGSEKNGIDIIMYAKEHYAEIVLMSDQHGICLLYTSPSPRDLSTSRMPSSA